MKQSKTEGSRRWFLGVSGIALTTACGAAPQNGSSTGGGNNTTSGGANGGAGGQGGAGGSGGIGGEGGTIPGNGGAGGTVPMSCTPSDDNILGPYYRPDAPFRTDLTENNTQGIRVTVEGRVLDESCQPIPGALIDLWQADDDGGYDNDGMDDPPADVFVLRGKLNTGNDGSYSFLSIMPGHYLNGAQYRPAHIHVRVSAPGFTTLTTQLYFEGDPYNGIDPFIKDSLIMKLSDLGAQKYATFDFVLATAP